MNEMYRGRDASGCSLKIVRAENFGGDLVDLPFLGETPNMIWVLSMTMIVSENSQCNSHMLDSRKKSVRHTERIIASQIKVALAGHASLSLDPTARAKLFLLAAILI